MLVMPVMQAMVRLSNGSDKIHHCSQPATPLTLPTREPLPTPVHSICYSLFSAIVCQPIRNSLEKRVLFNFLTIDNNINY